MAEEEQVASSDPVEDEVRARVALREQGLYIPDDQAGAYEKYAQADFARVPTGFSFLDEDVLRGGGLAPGDVMMIVARSEVGKSFFLQNILANIARDGTAVLDISLEMTVEQKFARMACLEWGLDPRVFEQSVRDGKADEYLEKFDATFPNLVVYKPHRTSGAGFDDFDKALARFEKHVGKRPRVVAIDFLGLVRVDRVAGGEAQRIPELSAMAERWADAHGVSLILLHQTGRADEGNPNKRNHGHIPLTMESLMYGGEQNADYIVGLYRPDREPPPDSKLKHSLKYAEWRERVARYRNHVFVQVLKNRHGPRTIESQYPGFDTIVQWPDGRMLQVAATPEEDY